MFWPRLSVSLAAMIQAVMSGELPAGKGTTQRSGRLGQDWADARVNTEPAARPSRPAESARRVDFIEVSPVIGAGMALIERESDRTHGATGCLLQAALPRTDNFTK